MTKTAVTRWLVDLAARKLGPGATVKIVNGEWVAERIGLDHKRARVTANNRDTLVWFLEQMPDLK